jgi:flagellin
MGLNIMSVINSNISALNAQSSLARNAVKLQTAMERLSTGIRINSAKDDAAGLAISNRMTTDIRGFAVAMRNANDAISLTQTAEGHLGQITDNLQRLRELAVQSANASNSEENRITLDLESDQLVAEINRIASNSSFNNIKLLDGSFTSKTFQIGANNASSDRLTLSVASAASSSLGVGAGSSYASSVTSAEVGATALATGGLSLNNIVVGAAAGDGVSYSTSSASGIAVANAINGVSGSSGVIATVNSTAVSGTAVTGHATAIASGEVVINGVNIGGIAAGASAIVRGGQVAAAINAVSTQTGVTATFSTTDGSVALSAADGRNITVTTLANAAAATTGLGSGGATSVTTRSTVTLSSTQSAGITVGGITDAALSASGLTESFTAATATVGAGVSNLDLTTTSGSQAALVTLDAAIASVNQSRASLGAYQNRLQFAVSNLQVGKDNLTASRSRILDTDYAAETTNLAKSQIVAQAATAMLAQANQQPQTVLALLK